MNQQPNINKKQLKIISQIVEYNSETYCRFCNFGIETRHNFTPPGEIKSRRLYFCHLLDHHTNDNLKATDCLGYKDHCNLPNTSSNTNTPT